jgi:hypothetical protein
MNQFNRGFVAEKWNWRTLASWFVPPLVVPIMLIVLLAGYVISHAGN